MCFVLSREGAKKIMKRILICSNVTAAAEKIAAILRENGYEAVTENREEAEKENGESCAAAVFVLSELQGWRQIVSRFSLETPAGILVLIKDARRQEAESELAGLGIPVLPLQTASGVFLTAVDFAAKSGERLSAIRSENRKLKDTISDLKLVDRAKCALIQYLNMTEADAHRFIEKQAMDKRLPRREIALRILNTYES